MKKQCLLLISFWLICIFNGCTNYDKHKTQSNTATEENDAVVPNEYGLIALKGNFADSVNAILPRFGYSIISAEKLNINWRHVKDTVYSKATKPNTVWRTCWQQNGWTLIDDRDGLISQSSEMIQTLSKRYQCKVFSFYTQKITGTVSFYFFNKDVEREIVSSGGEVLHMAGEPLKEEGDMNPEENFDLQELFGVLAALGFNWSDVAAVNDFYVIETRFEGMPGAEVIQTK